MNYKEAEEIINNNPKDLKLLSDKFKNSFRTVKYAVIRNGDALQYASDILKNNFEIVKIAVNNKGRSLVYASDKLKDDFRIAQHAIKKDVYALDIVSDKLKRNIDLLLTSYFKDIIHIQHFMEALPDNNELIYQFYKKLKLEKQDLLIKSLENLDNSYNINDNHLKVIKYVVECLSSETLNNETINLTYKSKIIENEINKEREKKKIFKVSFNENVKSKSRKISF